MITTIQQRIIRVLSIQTGIAPHCIHPEHTLANDLQSDSLDCIEIMMALEEEFGINIDQDEGEKLQTVQQVFDYVTGVCTDTTLSGIAAGLNIPEELLIKDISLTNYNSARSELYGAWNKAWREMVKMAVAVTCELDTIKNITEPLSAEEKNRIQQMVEDSHDALEAIGISYPLAEDIKIDDARFAHDVQPPAW
jgi:acyl carrier protein